MKNLTRLTDLQLGEVYEIFNIADEISSGKYSGFLNGKSAILFFPASSIRTRVTFEKGIYLFGGKSGNVGLTWKEASQIMGFELSQCCGIGYEMENVKVYHDIKTAINGKDIICTDSLSAEEVNDFKGCLVTKEVMDMANKNAVLNPCPPFYRGEGVSDDVIQSKYFVGYEFKKNLLVIQQAIMIWCMK